MGRKRYKTGSHDVSDGWRRAADVIKRIQKSEVGITQEKLWDEFTTACDYDFELDTFKDYLKPRRQPPGVDRFFICLARILAKYWPVQSEQTSKEAEYLSRFQEAFGAHSTFEMKLQAGGAAPVLEDSLRKIDETHSKVSEIFTALLSQMEEIKRLGITEAALRAIVIRIEAQMHNAPIEDILRRIDNFVQNAVRERDARQSPSNEACDLLTLRKEARAYFDAGEFNKVSSPFDAALEQTRKDRAEREAEGARDDARLLEEAGNYDLLTFDIERAVERYIEAAALLFPKDDGSQRVYLAKSASNQCERGTDLYDNASLLLSVALTRRVLSRLDHGTLGWGSAQCLLGDGLLELGKRESTNDRLNEAMAAFTAARNVVNRDKAPELWVQAQRGIGRALFWLGQRKADASQLEEAVAVLRRTMEIAVPPIKQAVLENDLANALIQLGLRKKGTKSLKEAIQTLRKALVVFNSYENSYGAMAQLNLGIALIELGMRERGSASLEEAVAVLGRSLEALNPKEHARDWAFVKMELGIALSRLGLRTGRSEKFKEALVEYDQAKKIITRENSLEDWAKLQSNYGNTLAMLGTAEGDVKRLQEAVAVYRDILSEPAVPNDHPIKLSAQISSDRVEQSLGGVVP